MPGGGWVHLTAACTLSDARARAAACASHAPHPPVSQEPCGRKKPVSRGRLLYPPQSCGPAYPHPGCPAASAAAARLASARLRAAVWVSVGARWHVDAANAPLHAQHSTAQHSTAQHSTAQRGHSPCPACVGTQPARRAPRAARRTCRSTGTRPRPGSASRWPPGRTGSAARRRARCRRRPPPPAAPAPSQTPLQTPP
jgi:hypothetical protein